MVRAIQTKAATKMRTTAWSVLIVRIRGGGWKGVPGVGDGQQGWT